MLSHHLLLTMLGVNTFALGVNTFVLFLFFFLFFFNKDAIWNKKVRIYSVATAVRILTLFYRDTKDTELWIKWFEANSLKGKGHDMWKVCICFLQWLSLLYSDFIWTNVLVRVVNCFNYNYFTNMGFNKLYKIELLFLCPKVEMNKIIQPQNDNRHSGLENQGGGGVSWIIHEESVSWLARGRGGWVEW